MSNRCRMSVTVNATPTSIHVRKILAPGEARTLDLRISLSVLTYKYDALTDCATGAYQTHRPSPQVLISILTIFNTTRTFLSKTDLYVLASRDRIVVSTLRCGRNNPGSNPGHGTY